MATSLEEMLISVWQQTLGLYVQGKNAESEESQEHANSSSLAPYCMVDQ
jgi:hypothetical protein